MNYAMITNHAHARTHEPPPPSPPRATRIQKNSFVAPIVASAEISKTINLLSKHGTINVIIREKWNGTNIEQNGTFKIPDFRNMVLSQTYILTHCFLQG